MKSHHQVALSVLTLCISQQLYAQTNTSEADTVLDTQISKELTSNSASNLSSDETPNVTLDTINVTAKARTGTALAQKISEMPSVTQVITENEIQVQATGDRTTGDILAQLIPSLGASSGLYMIAFKCGHSTDTLCKYRKSQLLNLYRVRCLSNDNDGG